MRRNGYATVDGECPRCDAQGLDTAEALAQHYQRVHEMPAARAEQEATLAFAGAVRLEDAPEPGPPHHVCQCGKKVQCDLMLAMQMEAHAKRLSHVATKVKERERRRLSPGPTRINPAWTTADVLRLRAEGYSDRAIGRMLNAHGATVKRAVAQGKA